MLLERSREKMKSWQQKQKIWQKSCWAGGGKTVLNSLLRWLWLAGRSLLANWADIRNQEEGDSERLPLVIGRAESSIIVSVSKGFPPGGGGPTRGGQRPTAKPLRCVKFEKFEGMKLRRETSPLATQRVATTVESNRCNRVTVWINRQNGQAEVELLYLSKT